MGVDRTSSTVASKEVVSNKVNQEGIQKGKPPVFTVDAKVTIELETTLALALGDFIIDNHPNNTALWALGNRLSEIVPPKRVVALDRGDREGD